jgi:hypothetical protein
MTEGKVCSAQRKDGAPCKAHGNKITGLCPAHSPGFREIQVNGGKSKTRAHMLEARLDRRLKGILDLLADSIRQCHEGVLSPQRAAGMSALATALIKMGEYSEILIRLEALEKKMKE